MLLEMLSSLGNVSSYISRKPPVLLAEIYTFGSIVADVSA